MTDHDDHDDDRRLFSDDIRHMDAANIWKAVELTAVALRCCGCGGWVNRRYAEVLPHDPGYTMCGPCAMEVDRRLDPAEVARVRREFRGDR